MKNKMSVLGFASVGAMAIALFLALPSRGQNSKPAAAPMQTSEPLPDGAMKDKATTSCTECHDSSIIVQQRLSKAAWTKEVDKMVKWGATVDPKDRDALVDYLSTAFSPDKPPYEAPRTAPAKVTK